MIEVWEGELKIFHFLCSPEKWNMIDLRRSRTIMNFMASTRFWGWNNTEHETASVCESWDLMRDPKLSMKCVIWKNEGIINCPVPQISTNTWILSPYQQSKAGISKKIQLMYVST